MAWIEYNPNPVKANGGVGDCAVRAVAKALNLSWEEAYSELCASGFLMGDMPSSDLVWSSVLRKEGFIREIIPNTCPACYTVADLCKDKPVGIFVVKSNNHVATVIDGNLYDSWNSEMNVPIYYWTRKEKSNGTVQPVRVSTTVRV